MEIPEREGIQVWARALSDPVFARAVLGCGTIQIRPSEGGKR
jgi:hypothetical protein